jgi:dipeptidyl aminopeptidase/acylaminoacyl peptidase
MLKKEILYFLIISIILFISCSENTTDTDSNTESRSQSEETENTTGTLEITTTTSGNSTDEDGYRMTLDGNNQQSIGVDDTVIYEDLEEDSYSVELAELDNSCAVDGDNPVSVDITADETTTIDFEITCEQSAAEGTIVFIKRVDQSTEQLFVMDADGSNKAKVGDGISGATPAISPDGSKIAYKAESAIWVVGINGNKTHQLTHPDEFYSDGSPAWSPDGTQIVYESDAEKNYNNSEIYIMDEDGDNKTQLTIEPDPESEGQAPDGSAIMFSSDRNDDGSAELHKIDVSNGEVSLLLEPIDDNGINLRDPAWSPDGSLSGIHNSGAQPHFYSRR